MIAAPSPPHFLEAPPKNAPSVRSAATLPPAGAQPAMPPPMIPEAIGTLNVSEWDSVWPLLATNANAVVAPPIQKFVPSRAPIAKVASFADPETSRSDQ